MRNPFTKPWGVLLKRRRPLSRGRRWVGLALLVVLVLILGGYCRLTDKTRLRAMAEGWLEDFSGGEVRIEDVRLDMFEGLHLVGVTIATPTAARFDPSDDSLANRVILRAATVFLQLRPVSVLTGHLVVPQITAINPEIVVARRSSDGKWNWEMMAPQHRKRLSKKAMQLPEIRLRDARVIQCRLDERGWFRAPAQGFWVEARPKPDQADTYTIALTRVFNSSAEAETEPESAQFDFNMRTLALEGSLPFLSVDEIRMAAPATVSRWLEVFSTSGFVRANSLRVNEGARLAASLDLREATVSVPLNDDEAARPPEQRHIRLDQIEGTITISGRDATADLRGRFHGRPVAMKGRLELPADAVRGIESLGFELEIKADTVQLPRADGQADEAERRFVQSWPSVSRFVRDFDGMGAMDLTARIRKSAGPGSHVEFIDGKLVFRNSSAQYIFFPYRLHELNGAVQFRPDGRIALKDIAGVHDRGRVVINGLLGGRLSQEGQLSITGEGISLTEDLLVCLDRRDQELIRRFRATAKADVHVEMKRPARPLDGPPAPWETEVDLRFLDGSVNLDSFPYPLDHLGGQMRIAKQRIEVKDLSGRRRDGRVSVSGWASDAPDRGVAFDLTLSATGIEIDEMLGQALPSSGRRLYERFEPTGVADIDGTLSTTEPGGALTCNLDANLSRTSVVIPEGASRLEDARARLKITPETLEVTSFEGRLGQAEVRCSARIPLADDDPHLSLHLTADRMPLDDRLRQSLPASLREVYDSFQPKGTAAVDARYERSSFSSRPAGTTQPTSLPTDTSDYVVAIEPQGCEAVYEGFALPLREIKGRITVTPRAIRIESTTARYENSPVRIDGTVRRQGNQTSIELAIDAKEVGFAESLRQVLPWRIRRLWNDVKPIGKADLTFDRLAMTLSAGSRPAWEFSGRAELKGLSLALGSSLTDIHGVIGATGRMGDGWEISGELDWPSLRIDGRPLSNVKAQFARPANDPVFRIQQILGNFCGGSVMGEVDIDTSRSGPAFGLSLAAREVSIGDFLNAALKPGQTPVDLQGQVEGNLVLAGRFGDPFSRHGSGSVTIREAQMLKLPFLLAMLQAANKPAEDQSAFQDALLTFAVDGDQLLFEEIDLRGKTLSMVGAGQVNTPTEALDLTLLIGSPLRLPRIEVLSELLEGVARELVEVRVEGTLASPIYRAELVRSIRKTLDTILNARHRQPRVPRSR
ncbi:MAG: hypothetical protein KA354_13335 [Phycisphaerae bacterium]|nr:hypothetical protein [Phycisphaerae bacterium]